MEEDGQAMAEEHLAHLQSSFDEVKDALADPNAAAAKLPDTERKEYEDGQQSVVDSRRRAEVNSGQYQLY